MDKKHKYSYVGDIMQINTLVFEMIMLKKQLSSKCLASRQTKKKQQL